MKVRLSLETMMSKIAPIPADDQDCTNSSGFPDDGNVELEAAVPAMTVAVSAIRATPAYCLKHHSIRTTVYLQEQRPSPQKTTELDRLQKASHETAEFA